MHNTRSLLMTMDQTIRSQINMPDLDSLYQQSDLIKYVFPMVFGSVAARVYNSSEARRYCSAVVTVLAGQKKAVLPPCVRSVFKVSDYSVPLETPYVELLPAPHTSDISGWEVQGNTGNLELVFKDAVGQDSTFLIEYHPDLSASWHYSDGAGVVENDTNGNPRKFVLSLTPTNGLLDLRPKAYVGSVLRVLRSGNQEEVEAIIVAHYRSGSSWYVETDKNLGAVGSGLRYEVVPSASRVFFWACASFASWHLALSMGLPANRISFFDLALKHQMKTLMESEAYVNARSAPIFFRDSSYTTYKSVQP
jgi:hypothetical protein